VTRTVRAVVLVVLAAGWAVAILLLWRSTVPDDLRLPHLSAGAAFSPALLGRTSHYQRFVRWDYLLATIALIVTLAVYARRGARLTRESAAGRIGTGMLLGMLGLAILWLVQLPFGLAGVWWDRRHGVSHESYVEWAFGNWVELGAEFLFVCLALLIVMALAAPLGDRWWIAGAPVFIALATFFVFLTPYLLPDTHRLHDPSLRAAAARLERAEGASGIPIEVEEVHGETSVPNAAATGLGPSKRIVVWDTLLDGRFPRPQVLFVLAHEIGHHAHAHLPRSIAWYALFAFPGAYLIARLTRSRGGMYEPAAVPLSLFVLVALQLVAQPLQNVISRRLEAEADWSALQTTRDPAAGRALFRRFASTALEEPNPPTWDYLLLETHPTLIQRLAMVEAWRRRYQPLSK
jgi:Zn-dependent protease with chaperone function